MISSFSVGKILGAYGAGVLADRLGERRVIVAGALIAAVFVAATISTTTTVLVALLLLLAGIAGSSATPAGGRLVLTRFPATRRALALSLRQTAIPLGGLVAAAILPPVAEHQGWRVSLVVAAVICALTAIPMYLQPHEPATRRETTPADAPYRNRNVVLLAAWGLLIVPAQYAILAFLALDLHQTAGLSLTRGALLVAVANVGGILGRIVWGSLSDRYLPTNRKPLLIALNVAGIVFTVVFLVLPRGHGDLWRFVPIAFAMGFTLIGHQGLFITMIAEAAGPERVGAATGFVLTFTQLGITLTPPVFGLVADLTGHYRAVWAALLLLLCTALVPASLIRARGT